MIPYIFCPVTAEASALISAAVLVSGFTEVLFTEALSADAFTAGFTGALSAEALATGFTADVLAAGVFAAGFFTAGFFATGFFPLDLITPSSDISDTSFSLFRIPDLNVLFRKKLHPLIGRSYIRNHDVHPVKVAYL